MSSKLTHDIRRLRDEAPKPRLLSDGKTERPRTLSDAIDQLEAALQSKSAPATTSVSAEVAILTKERDALKTKVASQQTSISALATAVNKQKEQLATVGVSSEPKTVASITEQMNSLRAEMQKERNPQKLFKLYERLKALEVEAKNHTVVHGKGGDREYVRTVAKGKSQWNELKA